MCWITLTPKQPHHHHHPHHHHSDHGSSVEELVRIRHDAYNPRYSKVRISTPTISVDGHHHHHHHHPHLHPLHMHPHHHHHTFRLHGHGKRRCPPPPPPPPSRSPSACPSPREPIYRTQIVEPRTEEIRETTRIALKEVRPERKERGRLRRVAGYEVLGKEVPWNWDCVSSVASGGGGGRKRRGSDLRYPPFGSMDRWL